MSRHAWRIQAVTVVVPARDEELLLPACLAALQVAAAEVVARVPGLRVDVVVVLDRCCDGSAAAVASAPGGVAVHPLVVDEGNVGAARAAGVAAARALHVAVPADRHWLAMTDADSHVPPDWLMHHLQLAEGGADAVVGTVTVVDWSQRAGLVRDRWLAGYQPVDGHGHVHGANLGLTAHAYLLAGGFRAQQTHEDRDLVAALADRCLLVRSAGAPVVTSSRVHARAPEGFAGFLDALAQHRRVEPA